METLIIDVETDRLQQLKDFLNSMNIKFRSSPVSLKESPYNSEFVEKIERSRKEYKEGKGTTITLEELNNLWK